MMAIYFNGKNLELKRDYPGPSLTEGESVIRVSLAGICGTDLEILQGYESFSGVLGHEFVGVVEHSAKSYLIGKRVVGEINCVCHSCEYCKVGLTRHCRKRTVLGIVGRDGAFAQYLTLPNENLHIIPSNLLDESAVLVEPTAAAFEILEQVHVDSSYDVVVLGDGRLGAITSQVLKNAGCKVICVGKHNRKMSVLNSLGIATLALQEIDTKNRST